ncbi:hypothetical protein ABFS82_10G116300 [Erythranthe guttata]|uniref:uncharacterized protein LOC105971521 n=1 Tax=Erythranthe guttata TaxID=4155 RepID=UPI00064D7D3A|nr:PREDICTED: uncharacterized protein LOC105971521 [Erythranthe guttata]|eukprot:XP_012851827.1 PREDICTED: uncharacterized protein LOC105971521 [Erythranthe guttata]
MRKWMLMFLLLLSILIHEAQGIRMSKGSASAVRQHTINEVVHGKRNLNEGVNNKSSGWIRKLITKIPISRTAAISKNDGNAETKARPESKDSSINENVGRKEENSVSVNSSSKTYKEIVDIAGMDYSLARRKSPVHN